MDYWISDKAVVSFGVVVRNRIVVLVKIRERAAV